MMEQLFADQSRNFSSPPRRKLTRTKSGISEFIQASENISFVFFIDKNWSGMGENAPFRSKRAWSRFRCNFHDSTWLKYILLFILTIFIPEIRLFSTCCTYTLIRLKTYIYIYINAYFMFPLFTVDHVWLQEKLSASLFQAKKKLSFPTNRSLSLSKFSCMHFLDSAFFWGHTSLSWKNSHTPFFTTPLYPAYIMYIFLPEFLWVFFLYLS